ncbi:MAG: type IV pili methyl-accepting chemotaxis transducer N-terminal domain-containing protein [Rhodocyclaceae bacterium]|nr:type IV pili methyl-accepting chemotaxis transducer N-terminal domain-containing protein [Rhodocyclaceae bacterium]
MTLKMRRAMSAWFLGLAVAVLAGRAMADQGPVGLASQQRMLAQRVVKAYSQIGLNVLPTAAMNQLTSALAGFDANLGKLDHSAVDDGTQKALSELALAWQPLKSGALEPVSRDRALSLSRQTDEVDLAAKRLLQHLQDRADTPGNRLVTLAGRQSALCQRIAKAYMLVSWGVESAAVREELDAAANEFSGGLERLRAQRENTDEIRRELDEMALQWEWLQTAIAAEGATSYRLIVAEATESILVASERVTRMYEQSSQ